MQRIPNPVSDLNIIIRVFRNIFESLKNKSVFYIDEISEAMIANNLVTSQGAIGAEALRRSNRKDRSRDPIYNQSKSYAELFRILGWIQSENSSLKYTFSLLGLHVAHAKNPNSIMSECLLGIAYPNEILGVQGNQTIRIMKGILLTMNALGKISRDEMIAGPMSIIDDTDETKFQKMISKIKNFREKPSSLDCFLNKIAKKRGISRKPTMENYTRFPISAIIWARWGVKKEKSIIYITEAGKAVAEKLKYAHDIRLSDFNNFPECAKAAFIQLSFYSMLERAGFIIEPLRYEINGFIKALETNHIKLKGNVYFSPCQQLSRETLKKFTPNLVPEACNGNSKKIIKLDEKLIPDDDLNLLPRGQTFEFSKEFSISEFHSNIAFAKIQEANKVINNPENLVSKIYSEYSLSNKELFYPLIVDLFCILGFDCRLSRSGQNYERADAIIIDKKRSIPIEIKSPGEEQEISVKGIRQALENKVILLSRKNYPTDRETTSLVVGFNSPNIRSDVHHLIEDIKITFNICIGVIDFRSLLTLAVLAVKNNKKIQIHNFHLLKGVINHVNYLKSKP